MDFPRKSRDIYRSYVLLCVGGAFLNVEQLYADVVGELERRADAERAGRRCIIIRGRRAR